MICSQKFRTEMEEKYWGNMVPSDAKNSFRDPNQTYLESPWTLWLVNKSGTQNKTWLECIHPIATFSTIQQFWGMYNALKPPSELPSHWEYALFRGGIGRRVIVPDWDDSENLGGGCMQSTGFNLDPKTIDHLWRDICLKVIEEAWIHTSDYINGTIVSTKTGATRFYVWLSPCKEHIWESVRDRIESVFAQDCRTPLKWTPHMERKSPSDIKESFKNSFCPNSKSAVVETEKFTRRFRSRSVGCRTKLDVDLKINASLQEKRTIQSTDSKKTEIQVEKQQKSSTVKDSLRNVFFRQNSSNQITENQQNVGHRRGRSCHGLKEYKENPAFNASDRVRSCCHGSGDFSTSGCKLCVRTPRQTNRIGRVMAMNVRRSKEMVDVSTQFNAKVAKMNAGGGDTGEEDFSAKSKNFK